jgi:CheY-like chemotaxis protein
LLNLVSNAVKYNFEGGRVAVRVAQAPDGRLRVSVADTGPGISPDKHAAPFQPFSRLGAEATGIEGTGIGLALSKRLVEMMGGAIGFASEIGVGSTFWVDWPLADGGDPARPALAAVAKTSEIEGLLSMLRGTVLYVEDNPEKLKFVELILARAEGLKLLSADNAELGLLMAGERKPDLVLMDINLPGMNGYQALERLKNDPRTQSIPVIACSANATAQDVAKGMSSGFSAT